MAPPRSASFTESTDSLARVLATVPGTAIGVPSVAPPAPGPAGAPPPQRRRLPLLVAGLLAAALVVAALSPTDAITDRPLLFGLLVVSVVLVDLMRIEIFDRSKLSPASVPGLALAFAFGPLGPIAAELAIAARRVVSREPAIRWSFDLGALSLAGASSAVAWTLLNPGGDAAALLAGPVAALGAYAVASGLVSVVLWFSRGEHPVQSWREQFAWLWPHYLAFGALAAGLVVTEHQMGSWAVLVFGLPVVMLWLGEQQYISRTRDGVRALRERSEELAAANSRVRELLEQAHASYLHTITTLGRAVQVRDPERASCTERVARLARVLAERLGVTGQDLHALNVGVVVYDIGRVALPPNAPADERCVELSTHILAPLDLPALVTDIAQHHLERYDGAGLPAGLSGDEIPLAARIVAVARAFDDLTSQRGGQPPEMAFDRALSVVRMQAGTRYCPRVVDALQACLDSNPHLRRYFGDPKDIPHAA